MGILSDSEIPFRLLPLKAVQFLSCEKTSSERKRVPIKIIRLRIAKNLFIGITFKITVTNSNKAKFVQKNNHRLLQSFIYRKVKVALEAAEAIKAKQKGALRAG
jgi:hypothetical protein